MTLRKAVWRVGCGLSFLGALFAFQRPFREFPGIEYNLGEIPLPPDYQEKTEWAFARLMFPPGPLNGYRGRDADWHTGVSLWTQDFPRADRHFSQAVRRLTRIHVRSVEQMRQSRRRRRLRLAVALRRAGGRVGPDRRAGTGAARVPAARRLLHGRRFPRPATNGRSSNRASGRPSPDRRSSRSPMTTPIFHTVYDLNDRYQVPGQAHLRHGYKRPRRRRQRRPLARHLRRQGPRHDRHLLQLRRRRRLGVCRRSATTPQNSRTWPSASASTTSFIR